MSRCSEEEKDANARLIAKAPLLIDARDVLEKCRRCLLAMPSVPIAGNGEHIGSLDAAEQARALLAKLEKE